MSARRVDWDGYLAEFHAANAGITEQVLARCSDGPVTPYRWLLDGVDPEAHIIDLGCGSGPARPAAARRWVGLDRSAGELQAARAAGRHGVILGDATRLPIADMVADVVTCSMSLMLIRPLDDALAEIHRVLRPGGELRLLLPTRRPLSVADRLNYLRIFWAGRLVTQFPPTPLRRHASAELEAAGLRVEQDASRRFAFGFAAPSDADLFVNSWYLPGITPDRAARARARARALTPSAIGVPLRRLTARKAVPTGAGAATP